MLYSDFAQPTVSTTADVAGTPATITYNGPAKKTLFVWGAGGAQTLTAAQAVKMYALVTGDGVGSGVVPNIPIGQWRGAGLAPQGANDANPTALPVEWDAPSIGTISIDVRNAASATAPLVQVGVIYSDGENPFQPWELANGDPWNIRGIPNVYVTATPVSVTTTAEASVGTLTVPPQFPNCLGLTTLGESNGVKVTGEEFFGACRYTNTGSNVKQFDPAQKWPFFGQLAAGLGAIIDSPGVPLPTFWHPLRFGNALNASIQSLVTLRTAVTNATSFQAFGAFT